MKILMVGHSQSGKTSYMAGLFKLYGNKSGGFGLWVSNSSKRANLKKLGENIAQDRYPDGTDIESWYKFSLRYDGEYLIPFNWYDYRGGALLESSKTSPDAQGLIEKINDADALIVFLDGKKIVNMTDDELEAEYDVLLWAIQKSISKRKYKDYYFPISFIMTKGDLYQSYEPLWESPGLQYFMPMIKTIKDSEVAAGMIGVVEVSKNGIKNVFAPLIFSLYYGMHHYIKKQNSSLNAEKKRFKCLNPNRVDDILCAIFGGESDREKARKSLKKIEEKEDKLEILESRSDEMYEILTDYSDKDLIREFSKNKRI